MSLTPVPPLPGDPELRARELRLQAMKTLTSKLAHDFNNFLTPILGYATLIQEAGGAASSTAQYAQSIERSGRKTEALMDTIMTAVRPERRFAPKEIDLGRWFAEWLDQWQAQLPPTIPITVSRDLGPCVLHAEPTHWQTAFLALLANARVAMPSGGQLTVRLAQQTPSETTAAHLGIAPGPAFVLTVTDDGGGMTPEVAARALDPLFSTGPHGITLGLGLTAVHSTARMHGGQVLIASRPEEGTSVTVWFTGLPRPDVEEKNDAAKLSDATQSPRARRNRVLLAGCDDVLRESLRSRLQAAEYIVHLAPDAAQAAKLLARHAPSLAFVVLEEQLPGTTGLAFAARIRESQSDLPIILLTLGDEPGAAARPSGPFAAIKKPFRWKGFEETAQRLLGCPGKNPSELLATAFRSH